MKKFFLGIVIFLTMAVACPFCVSADDQDSATDSSQVEILDSESSELEAEVTDSSSDDSVLDSVDTDAVADAVVSRLSAKSADRDVYYPEYVVHYSDNPRVFIVGVLNFLMLILIYRRLVSKGGDRQ